MDKKYSIISVCTDFFVFSLLFSVRAYANSSWHWISETRPYDVLPYVIVMTLFIETFSIVLLCRGSRITKVFCFVSLANLLSFLAPYVFWYWFGFRGDGIYPTYSNFMEHWPVFTVGILYTIMTLAVEVPVVYKALKRDIEKHKRLLWVIVASNLVTTLLTYFCEHYFCYGRG
ncbi:MAG: hypothetical protein IJT62_04030 [Oscillospiraceae bacterium]|nr:hypothetical protein [Oscillospiraceae bacterium]